MANDSGGQDWGSGLTPTQAQEFHKYFMMNFFILVGIAVLAHLLVWAWKPWFN